MTGPPGWYDVTVTVTRDGGYRPGPAEFAAAARNADVMSAHTAGKIISIVTVQAAGRPAAVAVALAVVSEPLGRPAASPGR
jgi:hypothetical protein